MFSTGLVVLALTALCGSVPQNKDSRIVGGVDVDIEDFPYQLSFEQLLGGHFCGASILSAEWALTAAHCVDGSWTTWFKYLRAGTTNRGEGGFKTSIDEILTHPQWDSRKMNYDFALVKVATPFPIGQRGIQSVKLSRKRPADDTLLTVSGWGALHSGGIALPSHLKAVNVSAINQDECNAAYSGAISDSMICAGIENEGGKDACQGDSGGPLINPATGEQVGVVSWGRGCAQASYPGIYSNVASGAEWIKSVTGLL